MTSVNLRIALLVLGLLVLSACNDLAVFPRPDTAATPQAPTGLTATPEAGKITLRWQDNSDNETGFTVYRQETGGVGSQLATTAEDFSELATVPENITRYEDTSITVGTSYRYAVSANGEEGTSGRTTTEEGTTAEPEPTPPAPGPTPPPTPSNTAPVATPQSVSTDEDTAVAITLAGSDEEGDTLSFTVVTGPTQGTLSTLDAATGEVGYTPESNTSGTDSFSFVVSDGEATSAPATVTIEVGGVNDAPMATAQELSTPEDTPVTVTLGGTDPEGAALTFGLVKGKGPSKGTLGTLDTATGEVTYTPKANENGTDSFTFTVSDGELTSAPATVTVNLGVVNDAPVAADQSLTINEDGYLDITLGATDAEDDALTWEIVTQPAHGTLYADLCRSTSQKPGTYQAALCLRGADLAGSAVSSSNTPYWIYQPDNNYNGPDSFTFKANDGLDDSNVATVSIAVTAVNDAPTYITLTGTSVAENQPVGTMVGSLSATDSDSSTFTYSLVAGTGDTDNASFTVDNDTDELKTAAAFDFETKNSYSVRVQVSDGELTYQESFTVTVTDVDDTDPTVTFSDPGQLTSGQQVTLTGQASDNETLSKVELFEGSTLLGTATLTSGTWTYDYTPATGGDVTLKAVATDAAANSADTSRTVTVFSPVVSNLDDSGPGSLRWTVTNAPAGTTLTFAQSLSGGTVTLTGSQIDLNKNLTIDGDVTIDGNANSRIFNVSSGATVVLKDLTVTNGNGVGSGCISANFGGGICVGGNLTLTGSAKVINSSSQYGGGMFIDNGTLTLQDSSSINSNLATDHAGGVFNYSGTLTLQDNSSISNNSAAYDSGGVWNESATLTLQGNSSISNNSAAYNGGGVFNYSATLTLEGNSSISNNSATHSGGGVYNYGTLTLEGDSSISNNTAARDGGGVYNYSGTLNGADYDGMNGDDNIFGNTPDQVYDF